MKKYLTILTALCLLLTVQLRAFAADSCYVSDRADLLTEAEEGTLLAMAEEAAAELDCGIYLVTVENYYEYGSTPQDAAEALYIEQSMMGNVPQDGILLMLSMAERDYSLITYGEYAEAVFTDAVMWDMEDHFLYYFGENDWYYGFSYYVSDAIGALVDFNMAAQEQYGEDYESYYEPGVPDMVMRVKGVEPKIWAAVIFGSMAVALVVCLIMKAGMRNARKATHANAYIPRGGVELRVKQDLFTHTTTRVIHHPKSNSSGSSGGGGGFRGHSGKF
ncbi:MAG: TPM domain-containing protein [Oscillospiraceae bacterium]|nr:TPM domain-containing protein [Oscillospiraceae bacterium]